MRATVILVTAIVASVLGCQSTPQPVATSVSGEDIQAADVAAIGPPIWIAYPQGRMPDDPFMLLLYGSAPDTAALPPIAEMPPDAAGGIGTAQDIASSMIAQPRFTAVRIVTGNAFDKWPATLELEQLLREAGWREVPGRRNLWQGPTHAQTREREAAPVAADRDISTQLVGSWAVYFPNTDVVHAFHFKPDLTGGELVAGAGTLLGSKFIYSIRGRHIYICHESDELDRTAILDDGHLRFRGYDDEPVILLRSDDPRLGPPEMLRSNESPPIRQWISVLEGELNAKSMP